MSVLINGMEMPKTCGVCPLFRDDSNDYCMAARSIFLSSSIKPDWCPLVPLPEGHGRLGDLDALEVKFREEALEHTLIGDLNRMTLGVGEVIDRIRMADTIVPAEGGTDECSEN